MIKKVLIANRAEIARRVIKSCKLLGISSVALYSEADKDLPHRFEADEAFYLGDGTLAETYLNQDKIVQAVRTHNAEGIHPGYGLLSENPEFATRLEKEGITFIGPTADSITLMGDKKASKVEMEKVGIPLLPGYHGDDQDTKLLLAEAKKIGTPLLIKAWAGGGGKGMRIVRDISTFETELSMAQSEAQKAFGNPKVLLEKYIENPRHIEVQVLSDTHGNHLHLFERECSIQRRYQKIVEETPSPALDETLRKNICETAVKISASINYRGAGTVEFILDQSGEFYFLEMNTRLQVEHPITEMVTGVDLVAEQIRVASGEKLGFSQKDLAQRGYALEVRIYAEDPDNGFLPTVGRISHLGEPSQNGTRLDCGFSEGNTIGLDFDPMLAKLITYGSSRDEAIQKMLISLDEVLFLGIKTNRDYLKRVLILDRYKAGDLSTHFVTEEEESLKPKELSEGELAKFLAASHFAENFQIASGNCSTKTSETSWQRLGGFRNV